MSKSSILELSIQRQFQLKQLRRLAPVEAEKAEAVLKYGLVQSAIKIIVTGLKSQLSRPARLDDPAHWPVTVGESIECLLGQDHEASREARTARAIQSIRKPTNEEMNRGLAAALKPGGGGPCHRPRASFGR